MRQFISTQYPDNNGAIVLTEKEIHYLCTVLRLKTGSLLTVQTPDGLCAQGRLDAETKHLFLDFTYKINSSHDIPPTEFYLFQIIPKSAKMDLIVRQATECGVKYIIPFVGDYSATGAMSAQKYERWNRIIREARQQSGSGIVTEILPADTITSALKIWQTACNSAPPEKTEQAFVFYEKNVDNTSAFDIFKNNGFPTKIALGVGCEGGISPREYALFVEHNFTSVHFKTNILRVETAALYGIASLQFILGEYSKWK